MLLKSVLGRTLLIICINVIIGILFLVFTDWDSPAFRHQRRSGSHPDGATTESSSPALFDSSNHTSESPPVPRGAYVTLVTGVDYVKPAVALALSIKETMTTYPMYALVTPDFSQSNRTLLSRFGWNIIEVPPIHNGFGTRTARFSGSKVMSKLWLWNLTNIAEKLAYIDADSLLMDNLDDIFDLCDNFCAPIDYVPHVAHGGYWYFSSGMMVVKPDLDVMDSLLSFASDPLIPNWDTADMGLLNRFYYFDCQNIIEHPIKRGPDGNMLPSLAATFRSKPISQLEYNPPSIPDRVIRNEQQRGFARCQSLPLQYNIKGGTDPPILGPYPKIIHFFDNEKAHSCLLDIAKAPYQFRTYISAHPLFCKEHPFVQLFMKYLRQADLL